MMDNIYTTTVMLALFSIVIKEIYRTIFIHTLKTSNLDIWRSLGKPSGYFSSYLFKLDGFSLEMFIFKRKHRKLGNNLSLAKLGDQLFFIQAVYFLFLFLFFVLLLFQLILQSPT